MRIPVVAELRSPRLIYVLDWIFNEVLKSGYEFIDEAEAEPRPWVLSYGKKLPNSITIPEAGLLKGKGITQYKLARGNWHSIPTIFHKEETGFDLPFDMLSAIFFLISRYEEYYPYTPDEHNRYPPQESIVFKQGWLERPLVDEWIAVLAGMIETKAGIPVSPGTFSYLPTYDIDIAYSYRYKGPRRTVGAIGRDLAGGRLKDVQHRFSVLTGKSKDPYDSYAWLAGLHHEYGLRPIYFVLCALSVTAFDKNISPKTAQMAELLLRLKEEGDIGMHPSYFSRLQKQFREEKEILQQKTGVEIYKSRQHYIRVVIPETYTLLIQRGIREDYSMGYGSRLGFRAGTGRSFPWYDISSEKQTELRVHPFAFMDTTARFEEGLAPEAAYERLTAMRDLLIKTGSQLITIYHNFSLGSDPGWKGWREQYRAFIKNTLRPDK